MRRLGTVAASAWLLAGAAASAGRVEQRAREILAPGLKHTFLGKGSTASAIRYRVVVGIFEHQRQADELLDRLDRANIPAIAYYRAGRYHIASVGLASPEAAHEIKRRLQSTGFDSELAIQEYGQDVTHPEGPWQIHIIEADPQVVRLDVWDGRITEVRHQAGSTKIPPLGFVISIGTKRAGMILPRFKAGQPLSVQTTLVPSLPDPEGDWEKAQHILGGGPLLLRDGHRVEEPEMAIKGKVVNSPSDPLGACNADPLSRHW
jgi:hypothetical protein